LRGDKAASPTIFPKRKLPLQDGWRLDAKEGFQRAGSRPAGFHFTMSDKADFFLIARVRFGRRPQLF
jgi:hypothetical protein